MNTKPRISIILTILSILALSTSAQAQNLVVSNSAYPAVSGTHYENNGTTYAALTISGSLGSFTGTNIILTGTAASGVGRYGANVSTQGKVNLTNSAINAELYGINLSGTSSATLNNTSINTGTTASAFGINLATSSTLGLMGGTIHTLGNYGHGVYANGTSAVSLNNTNIITEGTNAYGVSLVNSSMLNMTGGTITTGTMGVIGVSAASASYVTLRDTVINSYGSGINISGTSVLAAYSANITTQVGTGLTLGTSSTATITGGAIRTTGSTTGAASISGASVISLNNVNIITEGTAAAYGIVVGSGASAYITGGTISSQSNSAQAIRASGSNSFLYGTNVYITTQGYYNYGINNDNNATIVMNSSTIRTSGTISHAVHIGGQANAGTSYTELNNMDIKATGYTANAVNLDASYSDFARIAVLNGGSYISEQGSGIGVNPYANSGTGNYSTGVFDITVKGGARVSGTASVTTNGSIISAPPVVNISVNEASTLVGDVNTYISGSTTINMAGNSTLTGNLTANDATALTVSLDKSTLTGKSTVSATATLNLSLFDSGTWYMVDNSTLTNLTAAKTARVNFPAPVAGTYHKLTVNNNLGGEGGTFAMHTDIAAGKADLLTVGGTASTGAHRITLTNANDDAVTGAESPLLLVETAGGSATFTGTTTAGVYDYSVQNGAQVGNAFALPDTNWYLYRAGLSNIGNAIINTSALLGYDWFYSLDALYLRMGDVREENLGAPSFHSASASTATTRNEELGTRNSSGNLWLRARAYRLNADASLSGRPFNEYTYGLTAGADKAFHRDSSAATTLLGAFLDAGRIDRDFSGANNTGYTTSLSAGLYATYLRQTGWHADLVLKADRYKHHFDTTTADQLPVTGDYSNNALGASLEIGRRLQRADGYWVEPMVQAAYTWLQSANYRTAPASQALGVTVDSTRAIQYRALVRFGRRIQNSRWSPYGKFGVVKTDLTGGTLHIADGAGTLFVPDCDGWRVEFGAGTSYYINCRSQIYFDYEYDRAPHYERPWALNLGYRYGW